MLHWLKKIFIADKPPVILPPLKAGDFVRTDWFLIEQTARVIDANESTKRVEIWIMPVMRDGKKYDPKLTGIDFYYLQERTHWTDKKRILRFATDAEIKIVEQQYGLV